MKFQFVCLDSSLCLINLLFLGLWVLILTNCNVPESDFEPCSRHYELESLRPAEVSFDWIPYHSGQILIASSQTGATCPFRVDSFPIISKSERSFFEIPCYEDSSKTNQVFYASRVYQCKLINQTALVAIREIHITLYVFLDELNSQLDQLKMADILEISLVINNGTQADEKVHTLKFPVLDRGISNLFKSNYAFDPELIVAGKKLQQVYSNYETNEKYKIFYSVQGLLGFELPDGMQFLF